MFTVLVRRLLRFDSDVQRQRLAYELLPVGVIRAEGSDYVDNKTISYTLKGIRVAMPNGSQILGNS